MTKLSITIAALLALAIPASSSAVVKWLNYPSCSATTTTLTCTGKAAGLQRPNNNPLGVGLSPPEAAILGEVHYTCTDPVFTISQPGSRVDNALGVSPFHNGPPFSVEASPPPEPTSLQAQFACMFGHYVRDPNYYNVHVAIGFGFGSGSAEVLLDAPIGNVSP